MLKLFAGLALACLVTPAAAQSCKPVAGLIAEAKSGGHYSIADDVSIKGGVFDEIVAVVYEGKLFLWFAKGGCVVSDPLLMGDAAGAEPGTEPKPMRYRGAGLEIGV